jgi:translation elongation factor EF-Tu-like GTPase
VFTVEMHHKRVDKAGPGDNVGMNIKGLDKGNMPRTGDVMILKSDTTLKPVKDFTAQVRVCVCGLEWACWCGSRLQGKQHTRTAC